MNPLDVPRCEDCLQPFGDGGHRFAVLKRDRFFRTDKAGLKHHDVYPAIVCDDCHGWYDNAVDLTDD